MTSPKVRNISELCWSIVDQTHNYDEALCNPEAARLNDTAYATARLRNLLSQINPNICVLRVNNEAPSYLYNHAEAIDRWRQYGEQIFSNKDEIEPGIVLECVEFKEASFALVRGVAWLGGVGGTIAAWTWRDVLIEGFKQLVTQGIKHGVKQGMEYATEGDEAYVDTAENAALATIESNGESGELEHPDTKPQFDPDGLFANISFSTRTRKTNECDNRNIPNFSNPDGTLPQNAYAKFMRLQNGTYIPPVSSMENFLANEMYNFLPGPLKYYLPVAGVPTPFVISQLPLPYVEAQIGAAEQLAAHLGKYTPNPYIKYITLVIETEDCHIVGIVFGAKYMARFPDDKEYPLLNSLRVVKFDEDLREEHPSFLFIIPSPIMPDNVGKAVHATWLMATQRQNFFATDLEVGADPNANRKVIFNVIPRMLRSNRRWLGFNDGKYSNTEAPLTNSPPEYKPWDITKEEIETSVRRLNGKNLAARGY